LRSLSEEPLVADIVVFVIVLAVVVPMGLEVMGEQASGLDDARYQDCIDYFGGEDFRNGSMDGEYVCIQGDSVYRPSVDVYQGSLLFDVLLLFGVVIIVFAGFKYLPGMAGRIGGERP